VAAPVNAVVVDDDNRVEDEGGGLHGEGSREDRAVEKGWLMGLPGVEGQR